MTDSNFEISRGERFAFGKNWSRFLKVVNEERIDEAIKSLIKMLGQKRLDGLKFLDVGCGSGLFSLAAHRLGAEVYSFDFDPQSVATTKEMKARFAGDKTNWQIEQGSALDQDYLRRLGQFDIVYSWGVLHHTGNMWQALENVIPLVSDDGKLFIAIYNDQNTISKIWFSVKQLYCSGLLGRALVIPTFTFIFALVGFLTDISKLRNPIKRYSEYKKSRGMSLLYDWLDWFGGYPFEVAKPSEIQEFYQQRGFKLESSKLTNTLGCNEFVFKKINDNI